MITTTPSRADFGKDNRLGIAGTPVAAPLRLPSITGLINNSTNMPIVLANTPAIRDTDKLDYGAPLPGWYSELPSKPVHGNHQNTLFFDWHVGKVDPVTHLPK